MPSSFFVLCPQTHLGEVCQRLQANSQKVLIGFVGTAYLAFIIVVVHYFLDFVPSGLTGRIDRALLNKCWRKRKSRPRKAWGSMLQTAVLMFSDQQLVTGIALLASGFSQLHCGISAYHWQILVYLAWFCALTHLSTLTLMRDYFRENVIARF